MIVCPNCRHINEEDVQACSACGRSLAPGRMTLGPRRDEGERPPIEIRTPKRSPVWIPWLVIGLLVTGGIAFGVAQLLRPNPCKGTDFTSTQFGYCLDVPAGWQAQTGQVGSSTEFDQFQPPAKVATVSVQAVGLPKNTGLDEFATVVRQHDVDQGLQPGAIGDTTLDGSAAKEWDTTVQQTDGTSTYQVREVVTVRGGTAWRILLTDTSNSFDQSAQALRSMLQTWRFK